jgi:aspartyl-tRNA(Asn)/glutamyl-tRNA(Gln) amidotransferase subunit C
MSARIDTREVQRIARLACLRLTADEQERYALQLQQILAYAEQVQAVDTRDVPAHFDQPPGAGACRSDTPRPPLPRAAALSNAPERSADGSLFKVPRVLGG